MLDFAASGTHERLDDRPGRRDTTLWPSPSGLCQGRPPRHGASFGLVATEPASQHDLRLRSGGSPRHRLHSVMAAPAGYLVLSSPLGLMTLASERSFHGLLVDYLSHYFPLMLPAVLVVLPWLVGGLAPTPAAPNYAGDLVFATISFWVWAITTNSHSETLVRGSGRHRGTKAERKKEFLVLLIFLFIAIAIYIATHHLGDFPGLVLSIFSFAFPVLILGLP